MKLLAIIGIIIFCISLLFMSYKEGTQTSISQLSKKYRWLLLVALWSQILLLPIMLHITPIAFLFLAALGIAGIIFTGSSDVFEDELIHMISAIVSFILLGIWVFIINKLFLIPLLVCLCAGKNNLKWRCEVGLIIGVYMCILI